MWEGVILIQKKYIRGKITFFAIFLYLGYSLRELVLFFNFLVGIEFFVERIDFKEIY